MALRLAAGTPEEGHFHDVFDLRLSATVFKPFRDMRHHVFTVTGGWMVKAARIHREKRRRPGTKKLKMASYHWRLEVTQQAKREIGCRSWFRNG